jgi:hypothetical protein
MIVAAVSPEMHDLLEHYRRVLLMLVVKPPRVGLTEDSSALGPVFVEGRLRYSGRTQYQRSIVASAVHTVADHPT